MDGQVLYKLKREIAEIQNLCNICSVNAEENAPSEFHRITGRGLRDRRRNAPRFLRTKRRGSQWKEATVGNEHTK